MRVTFVVAMASDRLIGTAAGLPWHLPADLKRFRALTLGKPIIMGRVTREAIGRPLDKRLNVVLTRRADWSADGAVVAATPAESLEIAAATNTDEAMVIGGAEVYAACLPVVERLHLTLVEGHFAGSTYFPATIPTPAGLTWRVTASEDVPADAKNPCSCRVLVIDRVPRADQPAHNWPIISVFSSSAAAPAA